MALPLKSLFWVSLLAAIAIYVTMVTWTLPAITATASGALPFDMRPFGYDFAEAQAFLRALSSEGRDLYLNVQHTLDFFYPVLLTLSLGLGIALLCPPQFGAWKWALAFWSIPGSLFDYWENALVRRLLQSSPETLDPGTVAAASRATVLKSLFTTLVMCTLLALFLYWLYRKRAVSWRRKGM